MRLDRKLFWSYIVTILIAVSTSFTLFTVTSNQFLSYRLLDSMKKEMDLIQENLMVYNTGYFQPGVVIRNHIMQLVESELIIIQDNETVFYENKAILDDLQNYGVDSTYFKKHYLMISGSVEVMDWKFDIILLREGDGCRVKSSEFKYFIYYFIGEYVNCCVFWSLRAK